MEYVNGLSNILNRNYSFSGLVCVLIAFGIVTLAQVLLRITYAKYKKKDVETNLTGKEVAEKILKANDINNIRIITVSGELSDYYDNKNKVIALSNDIYNGSSIASLAVAAHECGHAIQYKVGYKPIKFRNNMVSIVNFGNSIGYTVMSIGLLSDALGVFYVGIFLLSFALIFQLMTLPCEFNASARANKELLRLGLINEKEHTGTKKMLKAAAFTYVAGLFSSIMEILRLILMFSSRRNKK